MPDLFTQYTPPMAETSLRLLAAVIAGGLIGLERESHGRAAGWRTTILACLASAVAMILSEILYVQSSISGVNWRPDPGRLGAGILTGIGFLGAGTIIRHENAIRGVTTAASLWFVTVLGLTFGSGQFALGIIGLSVALLVLFVLPRFERHIPTDWYSKLTVVLELSAQTDEQVRARIETFGAIIKNIEMKYDVTNARKTLSYELKLKKTEVFQISNKIATDLAAQPGVLEVSWR